MAKKSAQKSAHEFVQAFSFDDDGVFAGITEAQKDKTGNILLPNMATLKKPEFKDGYNCRFDGKKWAQIEIIVPEPEPIVEPTEKELALEEVTKLEGMMTKRAAREMKRRGDNKLIGYNEDGTVYCPDIEAEMDRLELEILGR